MAACSPLVSILSPVYNVADYLSECVDSILAQTYQNLQIILIDDGSQDNSWEICLQYAQQDSRIEAYHQDNQGVASTRNTLLSHAKGEFILFIDSDDWIEPDMVECLLSLSDLHKADIVCCDYVFNDTVCKKDQETIKTWTQEETVYHFLQHKSFRGFLWNKLIRASLFQNEQFQQGISYGEDALMCWYLFQKVQKVVVTNSSFYHHRTNNNSLSHGSFGLQKMSAFDVWKKISEETILLWPNYSDIALARSCIEMTILLREASHSGYKYDDYIKQLQVFIRKHKTLIYKTKLSSWIMYLYALIGGRNYKLLRLLP